LRNGTLIKHHYRVVEKSKTFYFQIPYDKRGILTFWIFLIPFSWFFRAERSDFYPRLFKNADLAKNLRPKMKKSETQNFYFYDSNIHAKFQISSITRTYRLNTPYWLFKLNCLRHFWMIVDFYLIWSKLGPQFLEF